MEKILVTGANGQLGRCLRDCYEEYVKPDGYDDRWFWTDVNDVEGPHTDKLDITDADAVEKYVVNNSISVIINCAAYTNVDKAENNQEIAEGINAIAPLYLATSAKKHDLKLLIHISTDYVFNGTSFMPITEERMTLPMSVYGKTKLEGEQNIINSGCKYLIFRTAWLYSEYGNNFVKTMLKLLAENREINVVNDQIGTPTYARDLAFLIFKIITKNGLPKYENNRPLNKEGVYHFTNEGVCSWYDFATAVKYYANSDDMFGFDNVIWGKVNGITTKDYYGDKPHAPRPYYSVLSKEKIKKDFGDFLWIDHWENRVNQCVYNIRHNIYPKVNKEETEEEHGE